MNTPAEAEPAPAAQAAPPVLEALGVEHWLGTGEGRVHVLRGVDLQLDPGQTTAIVGPSGCGKSTLLYLLGLLDRPHKGGISIDGQRLDQASEALRTRVRRAKIGFVFQFHFLMNEFSALENVALPAVKAGSPAAEARAYAEELLDRVGLADKCARRANQLSGGERQRVAVARALVNRPALLLADEPTGNLDTRNSDALFDLLEALTEGQRRQSVLIVTHNLELAARCDAVLTMQDGRFAEPAEASAEDDDVLIIRRPRRRRKRG